jgi:O-acetylhomoserine/O-acetylserine sulfhydrylase-like pyridoxal-dependent enzyme
MRLRCGSLEVAFKYNSRIMNPTCDALEQKMAALKGGASRRAICYAVSI